MTASTADVVVTDLHKAFGDQPVLTGLDLTLPAGSVTAVLGGSGSGKTTLLRIIAGFERPDRGSVVVGGAILDDDQRHVPANRRRIGYVSQEGSLFPHLSVEANVGFGLPRSQRHGARVGDLLDAVGLTAVAGRYPHQLSGGQQQRVALARSLAVGSQVVLFDEPFNTLDANLRASVRADAVAIIREAGATAILVTHDQDEALLTADLVAVIRQGCIAQVAPPADIYDSPIDADLARFVGEANLIDGTAHGDLVDTAFGTLTVRRDPRGASQGRVTALIRPEQMEIHSGPEGPGVPGRVLSADFHGSDTVVSVETEDHLLPSPIVARVLGNRRLVAHSPVRISVRGSVHVWPTEAASVVTDVAGPVSTREHAPAAISRTGPEAGAPAVRSTGVPRWAKIGIGVDLVLVVVLALIALLALNHSGPQRAASNDTLPPVVGATSTTLAAAGVDAQGGLGVTQGTLPPGGQANSGSGSASRRCIDPDDCPQAAALARDAGVRSATPAEVAAIVADVTPPPGQQFTSLTITVAEDTWGAVYVSATPSHGQEYIAIHLTKGKWTAVDSGFPTLSCDPSIPPDVIADLAPIVTPCG